VSAIKQDWLTLSHEERVRLLRDSSIGQIVQDYRLGDADESVLRERLGREQALWEARNVNDFEYAGRPPTKDIVLGAWRDLDRAEAILELIDNSIDAWFQRRDAYPSKTAKQLDIYIEIDATTEQLTYKDNAGGVSIEKLPNLVVPGSSDTTDLSRTIGSYKTGGKKAIFRLATAARITTRYWNPAESGDDAVSVQLDNEWIRNPTEYQFPYAKLRDKSSVERGQTCYVLQLRREPAATPWYEDPEARKRIENEIGRTYSLLLLRNPEISVYFLNKKERVTPVEDLYEFSGTSGSGIDIRPQQVVFVIDLEYEGRSHRVDIEVVLGCRTTVAGKSWGIDLYGNDRLFISQDQETFAHLLPTGNGQRLVRGFVNIKGPNVFIPWDTHKRHLNVDREITRLLKTHSLIKELFEKWKRVYNDISNAKVTALINKPLPQLFDYKRHDLAIPHSARVTVDLTRRRGVTLPKSVHIPTVRTARSRTDDTVKVSLQFTRAEARSVAASYGIEGEVTQRDLADRIKSDVLKRAAKR
jgi:hypothetical protein